MAVHDQRGIAVLAAVMTMMLLTAIGTGLLLTTSAEVMITRNFREGVEARYAAEAIAEFARAQLALEADWNRILDGSGRSTFTDGLPSGERTLAGGARIDLTRLLNVARCGQPSRCTTAEMDARTTLRPWGANNPRWQPYAYGGFNELSGSTRFSGTATPLYVLALVGDDGGESDGDPLRDGSADDPGAGVVVIRGDAFHANGGRATVEMIVARLPDGSVGIRSWRQI
jgi:hypothetical protein